MELNKIEQLLTTLKAKSTTPATPKQLGGKFKVWNTKPFVVAKAKLGNEQHQKCEIGIITRPSQKPLYAVAQKKKNKWVVLVNAPNLDKLIERANTKTNTN